MFAREITRDQLIAGVMSSMRRQIVDAVLFNHQISDRLGLSARETQFMNLLDLCGPLTPGRVREVMRCHLRLRQLKAR
jgi:hypothetical protein